MARGVPFHERIAVGWCPSARPTYRPAPWGCEPMDAFKEEDEVRFGFLAFDGPRGLTRMGIISVEDGDGRGTRRAFGKGRP